MKTALAMIFGGLVGIIIAIIKIALTLFICLGIPLILIYAIYRAIIGIMNHNAKLKKEQENNDWKNSQNRW